jgi:hypothetical protein
MGGHPFFIATQYHPEYKSRPGRPSPPFMGKGLHSFPFPLNLSLLHPFPLNLSSLCPPKTPN